MMDSEIKCPVCNGEPDVMYLNRGGEIVGCDLCLRSRYWFEVEVDE